MQRCLLVLAAVGVMAFVVARAGADEQAAAIDRAVLEKKFTEDMSGCTFVGHFTNSQQKDGKLKEERYTISEVRKVRDDLWLFSARIQYGQHDATLPLTLEVKWAGDTPVITMTDFLVPGFGKFTCRVLVYRGHYSGTWDAGDHGGHLFGRIERAKPPVNFVDGIPKQSAVEPVK